MRSWFEHDGRQVPCTVSVVEGGVIARAEGLTSRGANAAAAIKALVAKLQTKATR